MAPRYTKLRGDVYWFQLRVPDGLHSVYGKRQIQESLHTRDARKAASRALEMAGKWKQDFESDLLTLNGDKPRDIYLDTLRRVEHIKKLHRDPETREVLLDVLREEVLAPELARLGHVDYSEVLDDEWSPEASAALDAIGDAREGKQEVPPAYREAFDQTAANFMADRQRDATNRLTEQTRLQTEAVFRLFRDHIGNAPLATLQRHQVAAFFDKVKQLNRNWGRSAGVKDRTLGSLLAEAGRSKETRLSPRTINRYVSSLRQLWQWAEKRGDVSGRNPFAGFREKVRRNKEAHQPWTPVAIQAYFAKVSDPGKQGDPNPFYWLPRIAVLSGMRLNEICSLEAADIKSAERVTYFDIPAGKTESSVRVVPVHSRLKDFLKLAPKDGFLFPHLTPGGPDRKRSWNIGKRLNRGFRHFPGASDFHAFRKNVAEVFERAGVPENSSAQILGHAKPGMTYGVYSPNGLRIDQKGRLVEKLGVLLPQ